MSPEGTAQAEGTSFKHHSHRARAGRLEFPGSGVQKRQATYVMPSEAGRGRAGTGWLLSGFFADHQKWVPSPTRFLPAAPWGPGNYADEQINPTESQRVEEVPGVRPHPPPPSPFGEGVS
jgi:hypothetical protein